MVIVFSIAGVISSVGGVIVRCIVIYKVAIAVIFYVAIVRWCGDSGIAVIISIIAVVSIGSAADIVVVPNFVLVIAMLERNEVGSVRSGVVIAVTVTISVTDAIAVSVSVAVVCAIVTSVIGVVFVIHVTCGGILFNGFSSVCELKEF